MPSVFEFRPVAILRTPFHQKFGVPRQSGLVEEAEAWVEFSPECAREDFVRGLDAFSHIWLITVFHQNPPWQNASGLVRPPRLGGNDKVGVFASRAPNRPNPIGLSLVRLLAIEPGRLRVSGIDAVDGTPVLDIKPYLPWNESRPDARSDWAPAPPEARDQSAVIISAELEKQILQHTPKGNGENTLKLIRKLLQLDLPPAYHEEPDRVYGMCVADWNLKWKQNGGVIHLVHAERWPRTKSDT